MTHGEPIRSKRQSMGKRQRWKILARDGFSCVYCGLGASQTELHVDHVLAVVNGGTNDDSNLVTACIGCNLGKAYLKLPEGVQRTGIGSHPELNATLAEYEAAYEALLLAMLKQLENAESRSASLPAASIGMAFALVRHAAEIWLKTQDDQISKQRFVAMCAAQFEEGFSE